MWLRGTLSDSLLFPEMTLSSVVGPYILAQPSLTVQPVLWLVRGSPVLQQGERSPGIAPCACPPGMLGNGGAVSWTTALMCCAKGSAVLEFHVSDIFPKNHGAG